MDLGQRGHHHAKTMPTKVLGRAVHAYRSYLVTRSLTLLLPPAESPPPSLPEVCVCGSLRDPLSFPGPHPPVLTRTYQKSAIGSFSPQVPHSPWKLGRFQADTGPADFSLVEKRGSVISHSACPSLLCGQPGPAVGLASTPS